MTSKAIARPTPIKKRVCRLLNIKYILPYPHIFAIVFGFGFGSIIDWVRFNLIQAKTTKSMALKLKYETGVAATIQFISLTLLNLINGVSGSLNQCFSTNGSCVSTIALDTGYFLAITIWFGFLWLAGFATQDRRSRRIAQMLILAEGLVFLVGLYDFTKHRQSIIGTLISLGEIITSLWVSYLAFRLILARGGRVRKVRVRRTHSDA